MCVLLFDVYNECSLVKKQIGKGMSHTCYWSEVLGKNIWKNTIALKS